MSTSRQTAGPRAVVSLFMFVGMFVPAISSGQGLSPMIYGGSRFGYPWANFNFDTPWNFPAPAQRQAPLISADFLRHPLSGKAARALARAHKRGMSGDHRSAVAELREALTKFPKAAPYIHNLSGVEYVELQNFAAAKEEFAQVLETMPHISANHSNYGLVLAALGENREAEHELRMALVLDEANQSAKLVLDALLQAKTKEVSR